MYVTNGDYTQVAAKLFPTYADKQTPRATVLTCADSRVHTTAFDASPENDDFMVRNIGNQVENALGSVEYGVEHLETPVLFILGHTGCGAVKAAMTGTGKLEKPIQKELEHIHPPKKDPKKNDKDAWADAVVANVHDQVTASLEHFGRRVQSGKLTVVGAVLDFRNDMGNGAGRIVLVNVNGNREPARIDAFIDAVTGRPPDTRRGADDGKAPAKGSAEELVQALSALRPAGERPKNAPRSPDEREPAAGRHPR
jgi:carbonic anhydrase